MSYSFQNKNSSSAVTVGELNQVINGVERPYKVYTAFLTQNGTTEPVAAVLENTLGGEIVFTYDNAGQYYGELINGFVDNKTFILVSNDVKNQETGCTGLIQYIDVNTLIINSFDGSGTLSNGIFNNTPIEIRVYN